MSKKPLILGIETSCDETAASLISENDQGNPLILSNLRLYFFIKSSFFISSASSECSSSGVFAGKSSLV